MYLINPLIAINIKPTLIKKYYRLPYVTAAGAFAFDSQIVRFQNFSEDY
jgi:hypothetical protein